LLLLSEAGKCKDLQPQQTTDYTDRSVHLFLEDDVVHQDHAVLRRALIAIGADADGR
jgi:hypothetical protein